MTNTRKPTRQELKQWIAYNERVLDNSCDDEESRAELYAQIAEWRGMLAKTK